MNIYVETSITNGKQGKCSLALDAGYATAEVELQKRFMSHGNNVAHAKVNGLKNQVTGPRDIEAGRDKGHHVNTTFIRSMCFCYTVRNKYDRYWYQAKSSKYNYLPTGFKLQELYQGIIYLFDADEVRSLWKQGLVDYMQFARDSKTHVGYTDPSEFLGEWYIYDRKNTPSPKYIIVGNIGIKIDNSERINLITNWCPEVKKIYPETDIIYFENAGLYTSKPLNVTGNLITSKHGEKLIKHILKVDDKKVSPTFVI